MIQTTRNRIARVWVGRSRFLSCYDMATVLWEHGFPVWLGVDSEASGYKDLLEQGRFPWTFDLETAEKWLDESKLVIATHLQPFWRQTRPNWPPKVFEAFQRVPHRAGYAETPGRSSRLSRAQVYCNILYTPDPETANYFKTEKKLWKKGPVFWGISVLNEPYWQLLPSKEEARNYFGLPQDALVVGFLMKAHRRRCPKALIDAVRLAGAHLLVVVRAAGARRPPIWKYDPSIRDDPMFHILDWQYDLRPFLATCDVGYSITVRGLHMSRSDILFMLTGNPLVIHPKALKKATVRELVEASAGRAVRPVPEKLAKAFEELSGKGHGRHAIAFAQRWNRVRTKNLLEFVSRYLGGSHGTK